MSRSAHLTKFRYVVIFLMLALVCSSVGFAPAANAAGFFNNGNPSTYGSGPVISGGVPSYVQNVPALMSFLRNTYYSAPGGRYNAPYKNQVAVAYFVRLLLADGNSYTVTEADFNRLESLLQPTNGVSISWNEWATGSSDTYSCQHYVTTRGADPYDVCKYAHSWGNNSIVIRQTINGVTKDIAKVQRICFNPDGNAAGGLQAAPQDFNLTPTITVDPSSTEGSGQVTPVPSVNNSGSASSTNAQWQVTTFKVDPKQPIPGGGADNVIPVTHYGNGATVIQSGTRTFPKNFTAVPVGAQTVGDYPVGTRICYALSVQPRRHDDSRWQHSTPACVTISKKPKVQVLGNDLSVGRVFNGVINGPVKSNIYTSVSQKALSGPGVPTINGSWVEYGILATGTINGMASASAYSGGATAAGTCSIGLLSFTNAIDITGCKQGNTLGGYTTNKILPDVASSFPIVSGLTPSFGVGDIGNQAAKGVFTAADGLVIHGGTINKGRWVVINAPNSTVTIDGNITYDGGIINSVKDIPQLIIIAKNINITSAVTRIDAWLVATSKTAASDGKINTCSDVAEAAPLTINKCQTVLTVNGPVIANKLLLRRTGGSDPGAGSGNPAEIFNLRPDAYIWALVRAGQTGRIQTVYSTELPPRL